jgi:glycosyltransferase involved in cell wall biosynthesis
MHSSEATVNVTVLMPVYNGACFLREAIDSILCQTYSRFEFLIINDGSTDDSEQIIRSYTDNRIRLVNNEKNLGLIKSLNKGIKLLETKYIARADADDICLPTRLEKQVSFMEQNPEIGLCGTWFDNFDNKSIRGGARYSSVDSQIKLKHMYQIHLSHGTAMFRTEILKYHNLQFDSEYEHAEDYDLFDRVGTVTRLANIPEVLYHVRQHENSVSKLFAVTQRKNSLRVRERIFNRIGIDVTDYDLKLYQDLQHQIYPEQHAEQILELLENIYVANCKSQEFEICFMRDHLASIWYHFCSANARRGFLGSTWFQKATFVNNEDVSLRKLLRLRIKEFVRP